MDRERVSASVREARKKILPASYDWRKAVLGAVIALLVFGIGAMMGVYLPWWITLVLAAGVAFGGYVGMAYFDKQYKCEAAPPMRL